MSNEKYYPFKGIDFTAEEINALLKSIQNKIDRNLVRDGKSAYEVAVQNGYTGTVEQWLASLRGPAGNFENLSPEQIKELQRPSVELAQQAVENSKEIWFPHVDSSGVINWTRSKIEDPPQGVSIKGDKGDKGDSGVSGATDDIIVVNSLDGGGGNPDKIYVLDAEHGRQLKNLIDAVQGSVDAVQDSADATAEWCGFVIAKNFDAGSFFRNVPAALRKPGLIVACGTNSIGDKYSDFDMLRFTGKDTSDEFWNDRSYWEEVFKEPTPYVLTSSKIYDVLPKGSILQSAYGNIFGDKWAPMENVVTWDLSNVEEIDGTVIKGYMKAVYAKGYYYCYGLGLGILYSSDLNTWNIADLRGDGQNYSLFSLIYSKSNDTLFATAIVDENNTVKSYYSKDGITWNEYTVGDAVIVGFVVSGNNTMLADVIDGTSEKMKYYIADGTDIESVSWSLLSDKEYIPTLYSAGCIYFDDTRSRYITVTGDGIYEKNDDTTSLLELKAPIPEYIAMPELSANDKDNTYILRSQWDIHRFTYIAKNKDTTTWEEFKVQVSTDGEMLSSFVFSIKDIYYVLQPATFVGGALDNITPIMGYPVFEYAVTDGENFIGFNFTEGKIYKLKLAQVLEKVQYGYIKIQ